MRDSYFNSCCYDCKHKEYCKAYEVKSSPCDSLNFDYSEIANCKKSIKYLKMLCCFAVSFSVVTFGSFLGCLISFLSAYPL